MDQGTTGQIWWRIDLCKGCDAGSHYHCYGNLFVHTQLLHICLHQTAHRQAAIAYLSDTMNMLINKDNYPQCRPITSMIKQRLWLNNTQMEYTKKTVQGSKHINLTKMFKNFRKIIDFNSQLTQCHRYTTHQPTALAVLTRSSAIAEGPRDASCQLKPCQLPRNSGETTCTTSPEPSISCR